MQMELHSHQSFQGDVLWGWLNRFPLQFHFIHWLAALWLGYDGAWLRRLTTNRYCCAGTLKTAL
ncbi:MAG TPA: hypothetical protein VIM51_02895 [Desulfosporosinus sp.]